MNLCFSSILLCLSFLFASCGHDHDEHGTDPSGKTHSHTAPHGGMLLEVGEHGSGYNLELVLHDQGFLQIYVLDAHADNFQRISSDVIEVLVADANGSPQTLVCDAIADPITGETIGDTALFTSRERINNRLPIKGVIPSLQILSRTFEDLSFEFSGNSEKHEDEH
jgi:hypothetical protein